MLGDKEKPNIVRGITLTRSPSKIFLFYVKKMMTGMKFQIVENPQNNEHPAK